ncbi:MAG: S8/S53 family peptidase [Candidatus Sericytochromatia bacterium]
MKNKIFTVGLVSASLLLSCQISNFSNKNSFKIYNTTPSPGQSTAPFLETEPPFNVNENIINKKDFKINNTNIIKKESIDFTKTLDYSLNTKSTKAIVFYHNNDKFRIRTSATVKSINAIYSNQINSLLDKYNVKSVNTFGYYDPEDDKKVICLDKKHKEKENNKKNDDDDKKFKVKHLDDNDHNNDEHHDHGQENKNDKGCDSINYIDSYVTNQELLKEQQEIAPYFEGEFPDKLSIHIYNFTTNQDAKNFIEQIKKLSFVRGAELDSELQEDSNSLSCGITENILGASSSTIPNPVPRRDFYNSNEFITLNDSGFYNDIVNNIGNSFETLDWYWFNQVRAFRGWQVYGNTPMPRIAVIDGGFGTIPNLIDKPNYEIGFSINAGNFLGYKWEDIKRGDNNTNQKSGISHGHKVSYIASAPRNNEGLAGVAYGASILPVKEEELTSIILAKAIDIIVKNDKNLPENNKVDVINISQGIKGTSNRLSENNLIKVAMINAIKENKVIVQSAGNSGTLIQNDSISGIITVGGTTNLDPIDLARKESQEGGRDNIFIWSGSNYGNTVDISAPAEHLTLPRYDPSVYNSATGIVPFEIVSGTSYSAPQVSAAIGMVKKIALQNGINLNPYQSKYILTYSATLGYDNFYSPKRYLGFDLQNINTNPNKIANIRQLNLYNALIIAKNLANYGVIMRQYNSDDMSISTINNDWNNYIIASGYGSDDIVGLNFPNNKKFDINFRTYNYNSGYSYGYSLFYGKKYGLSSDTGLIFSEMIDGVFGWFGADNNNQNRLNTYALNGTLATIYPNFQKCNTLSVSSKASSLYGLKINGITSVQSNTLANDIQKLKTTSGSQVIVAISGDTNNAVFSIDGTNQEITGSNSIATSFKVSNNLTNGVKDVTVTTDGGTVTLPNAIDIQNNTNQTKKFPTSITVNGVTTNLDYGYIFNPQSQGDLTDYSFNNLNGIKLINRTLVDNSATWVNDNGKWGLDFSNSPFSALEVPDGNYEFLDKYTTIALVKLVKDDSVDIGANTGFYLSKWWSGSYYDHSKLNNFTDKQLYIINTNQGKDPNTGDIYYVFKSNEQVTETGVPFAISESLNTITNIKTVVKNQSILSTSFVDSAYPSTNLISVTDGRGRMFLDNYVAESYNGLLWGSDTGLNKNDLNLKGVLYGFAIIKQALNDEQIKELHKQMGL